ncbi:hypothetical protein MTsPCn5_39900 [Croceitalea sp. MTPC5]|uniref:class I SAM-dependent methyltransferase n=1 Tax=Croceitalea sp. MTPC5 TaxID=3056565 RepID=UPI002B3BACC0|nr:hypothetical protein MTsPCn5_39900 [Croceitalea sp. MTPC5]
MNDAVLKSWQQNAGEWIKAITENTIASRTYTNKAIVDTALKLDRAKIIDIGCGEGWLVRVLENQGKKVLGIDAIAELLQSAQSKRIGTFHQMTFEEIMDGKPLPNAPFDMAIFNFCLYQKEGLVTLLSNTAKALNDDGHILIQTLHPYLLMQQGKAYQSQWLSDSWKGLSGNFSNGHAWYARTLGDWSETLNEIPNTKVVFQEVTNEEGNPISLLIHIEKHL